MRSSLLQLPRHVCGAASACLGAHMLPGQPAGCCNAGPQHKHEGDLVCHQAPEPVPALSHASYTGSHVL